MASRHKRATANAMASIRFVDQALRDGIPGLVDRFGSSEAFRSSMRIHWLALEPGFDEDLRGFNFTGKPPTKLMVVTMRLPLSPATFPPTSSQV